MKVFKGVSQFKSTNDVNNSVVTVGNFDGVHRGHRVLIGQAREKANRLGGPLVVITFEPHPLKVLAPQKNIRRIFPLGDQEVQMKSLGVDYLIVEPFNKKLADMSREDFILQKINKVFKPKSLVVGYDFSFGKDRKGTPDFLLEKSQDFGFEVDVVPPFKIHDTIVSSTEIRKRIETGKIEEANEFLGRNFYLEGSIVKGKGRGKGIGVPTANLDYDSEIFPLLGVYVTLSFFGEKKYFSVTNVGNNPTFNDNVLTKPLVETFIFDFSGDMYGEEFRLDFLEFLRPEMKFSGVNELKTQIQKDITSVKEWFRTHGD
ncbi:MAG: hypothetical protein A4S09_12600 [Proteobacteria bacterium SG_bin7]|nr:MAG: hypothetical protein A4S09_12600 [Proteobacteria bacterium SG_bin7]